MNNREFAVSYAMATQTAIMKAVQLMIDEVAYRRRR